MRTLFSLALISLCFSFSAQETITYPYNPDGNQDGTITVPDLQDFLGNYGSAFAPSEITVNGETLSTVILDMQNTINELINLNDSPTTVIHGAYNFSDESQFLIPNYVNTVYLELEGATGGNGFKILKDPTDGVDPGNRIQFAGFSAAGYMQNGKNIVIDGDDANPGVAV